MSKKARQPFDKARAMASILMLALRCFKASNADESELRGHISAISEAANAAMKLLSGFVGE